MDYTKKLSRCVRDMLLTRQHEILKKEIGRKVFKGLDLKRKVQYSFILQGRGKNW
jgi:hypothetical protein